MTKFLTKTFLLAVTVVAINTLVGVFRMNQGEPIPYLVNSSKQYMVTHGLKPIQDLVGKDIWFNAKSDLGQRPLYPNSQIWRRFDQFGFSNIAPADSLHILYIGDSFLADYGISTKNGIQAKTNHKLKGNIAYNIGEEGCSGFRVYNELRQTSFLTPKPKLIVFEVVERNAYNTILSSVSELVRNEMKTSPYNYYYADLLLGDNFEGLDFSPKIKPAPYLINEKEVLFLKNQITRFNEKQIREMVESMKLIEKTLAAQGISILFVVGPDKESLHPELFGPSSLPNLQEGMRAGNLNMIDMYSHFMENRERSFYYEEDTHWNEQAIDALTDSVSIKFQQLPDKF